MHVLQQLSLLIVPAVCAYCKIFLDKRNILCDECLYHIFPVVSKKVDVTSSFSMTVFAIADYKDPLKKLILAKGWSDNVASYHLGHILWNTTPLSTIDYDFIVPIPLHWTRYAMRGFNQAHIIARVIHKKKQVPLVHLLKRVKKTAFQFALVSSMRGNNVKNAFVLDCKDKDKEAYRDKHILLIDDLMTTGSTVREAAKVLLELKPRSITVAVVCRVL
jgi:competence protein ComFC